MNRLVKSHHHLGGAVQKKKQQINSKCILPTTATAILDENARKMYFVPCHSVLFSSSLFMQLMCRSIIIDLSLHAVSKETQTVKPLTVHCKAFLSDYCTPARERVPFVCLLHSRILYRLTGTQRNWAYCNTIETFSIFICLIAYMECQRARS